MSGPIDLNRQVDAQIRDLAHANVEAGKLPLGGERSKTLSSVIADLEARERKGIETYGTTVDRTDLTAEQWEQHLYEELLDAAMYLNRRMAMRKGMIEEGDSDLKRQAMAEYLQEDEGWRPIESAPRDGSYIFLFYPGLIEGGHAFGHVDGYWDDENQDFYACPYWGQYHFGSPTHWMPLPQPPREGGEG